MARKARVEFSGTCYHLLDRGDRGEAIFYDEADRARFLATLGQVCARTGWRVHAFVLMRAQRKDIVWFPGFQIQNLPSLRLKFPRHSTRDFLRVFAAVEGRDAEVAFAFRAEAAARRDHDF